MEIDAVQTEYLLTADTGRTRRLSGLRQGWYFGIGFIRGWRHPIDRRTLYFVPQDDLASPSQVLAGRGDARR
jgi:hypothetical protein